ncbi:HD-GYP domain-containing protein [Acetoanaerobium noterae]|uniref:HD-GYP domain-containing protein n=1 Tax=Acetoanaerobium noterae TaxID=745369 RepID=UPI00324206BC
MENTTLSQFFDFEVHFKEFIKRNSYFTNVASAYFAIFNDNTTRINYKYKYNFSDVLTASLIKSMISDSEIVEKNHISEIRKCNNPPFECGKNVYMINAINPASNRTDILGSLIVCSDIPPSYSCENSVFNLPYFLQIVYHIETVLSNYEKIYYIVDTFTEVMASKDTIMPYHMTGVANNCIELSIFLGLEPIDQTLLYFSALLHDIGKLFIPEAILNKEEELTDDELSIFKIHARKSEEMLKTILHGMTLFEDIPKIVRHHHENYDGSGYPDGLSGEGIPYLSRLLAVADAVDKISSKNAYKTRGVVDSIIKELKINSGKVYDPALAKAMIKILVTENENLIEENTGSTIYIPQCSFSFSYMEKTNIKSLTGNLILRGNSGTFVIHDYDNKIYSINAMLNSTISFFKNGEIFEYKVLVKKIEDGRLYLDNIRFLPTDTTFSMVWNNSAILYNKELNKKNRVDIIKLGGDAVIFTVDKNSDLARELLDNIKGEFQIHIKESIDEIELDTTLNIKIVKYYLGYGYTFICRYLNIQSGQKDLILRLLFRKQMENRKWKTKLLVD